MRNESFPTDIAYVEGAIQLLSEVPLSYESVHTFRRASLLEYDKDGKIYALFYRRDFILRLLDVTHYYRQEVEEVTLAGSKIRGDYKECRGLHRLRLGAYISVRSGGT